MPNQFQNLLSTFLTKFRSVQRDLRMKFFTIFLVLVTGSTTLASSTNWFAVVSENWQTITSLRTCPQPTGMVNSNFSCTDPFRPFFNFTTVKNLSNILEDKVFDIVGHNVYKDQVCSIDTIDLLANGSEKSRIAQDAVIERIANSIATLRSVNQEIKKQKDSLRLMKGRLSRQVNKVIARNDFNQKLQDDIAQGENRLETLKNSIQLIHQNNWSGETELMKKFVEMEAEKTNFNAEEFAARMKFDFSSLRNSIRDELSTENQILFNQMEKRTGEKMEFFFSDETKVRLYEKNKAAINDIVSNDEGMACSLDARYGRGRENLRKTVDIGLLFLFGGYGAAIRLGNLSSKGARLLATGLTSSAAVARVAAEYERKCKKKGVELTNKERMCVDPNLQLDQLTLKQTEADCIFNLLMSALDIPIPELKLVALASAVPIRQGGFSDIVGALTKPERRTTGMLEKTNLSKRATYRLVMPSPSLVSKYPGITESLDKIDRQFDSIKNLEKAETEALLKKLNNLPNALPQKIKSAFQEVISAFGHAENWKNFSKALFLEVAEWIEKFGSTAEKADLKKGKISKRAFEEVLRSRAAKRGENVVELKEGEFTPDVFFNRIAEGPVVDNSFANAAHGGLTHLFQMEYVSEILKKHRLTHQEFYGVFKDWRLRDYWNQVFDESNKTINLFNPENLLKRIKSVFPAG